MLARLQVPKKQLVALYLVLRKEVELAAEEGQAAEAREESHSKARTHGLRAPALESINLGSRSLSAFAGCVTLDVLPSLSDPYPSHL